VTVAAASSTVATHDGVVAAVRFNVERMIPAFAATDAKVGAASRQVATRAMTAAKTPRVPEAAAGNVE
jgi:hypothetical protein